MQKRMQVTNAQLDELLQSGPTYYLPATSSHKNSAISHPGAPPRHSTTRLPRCSSYSRDFPLHELILPVFGFNVNKIIQCVFFLDLASFTWHFAFSMCSSCGVFPLMKIPQFTTVLVCSLQLVDACVFSTLGWLWTGLQWTWCRCPLVTMSTFL